MNHKLQKRKMLKISEKQHRSHHESQIQDPNLKKPSKRRNSLMLSETWLIAKKMKTTRYHLLLKVWFLWLRRWTKNSNVIFELTLWKWLNLTNKNQILKVYTPKPQKTQTYNNMFIMGIHGKNLLIVPLLIILHVGQTLCPWPPNLIKGSMQANTTCPLIIIPQFKLLLLLLPLLLLLLTPLERIRTLTPHFIRISNYILENIIKVLFFMHLLCNLYK